MMVKKGFIVFLILIFGAFSSKGEMISIKIGINGLTCSMCSRTVEKSLLQLPFIDRVEMNIATTEARILVKENFVISIKDIARSVKDAGFSVRSIRMEMDFKDLRLSEDGTFNSHGLQFKWLGKISSATPGYINLLVIDPPYLPSKERAKWSTLLSDQPQLNFIHVVLE